MKKKSCVCICLILTIIMFFSNMGNTYSVSISELNKQKSDIKSKIDQANKEIEKLSSEMNEVQKQISQLNAQVLIYQEEINRLEAQISDNETNLVQLQEKHDKRSQALAARMIAQYEAGETTYLDFLLNSESLSDFISNYYVVGELIDIDTALLNDMKQTKVQIEATKQQLVQDKAEIQEQKSILETKIKERENYRNQLNQQKAESKAEADKFEAEAKAVQEKIDQAVREANDYQGSFSGTLSWPLSTSSYGYNLITSGYGMRDQPVAGASRNHRALDIGVSYKPVYAAADGYVVIASSVSGYGNFIMIKHSNNLYTCYGHLNSFNVHSGQTVTRGQQIAVSGNTGVSSGPHLHFEVRTSSAYDSRVNPLNYIGNDIYSKLVFMF